MILDCENPTEQYWVSDQTWDKAAVHNLLASPTKGEGGGGETGGGSHEKHGGTPAKKARKCLDEIKKVFTPTKNQQQAEEQFEIVNEDDDCRYGH